MKTAAAYIRVSTEDQVEFSPDSQLKAIRKYAKEHDLILPESSFSRTKASAAARPTSACSSSA